MQLEFLYCVCTVCWK